MIAVTDNNSCSTNIRYNLLELNRALRCANRRLLLKKIIAQRRLTNALLKADISMNPPRKQVPLVEIPFAVPQLLVNRIFCYLQLFKIRSSGNSASRIKVCILCANQEITFVNAY